MSIARALTVAGSDPSGGAGIQADLRTFAALGVHGLSAVTAVTVQDTTGVSAVHPVPPAIVRAQIEAVVSDIGAQAAKTGALGSAATVQGVAEALERLAVPNLVCDPVLTSTSGTDLLARDAVGTLVQRLLPLVTVLTPNLPEAARLLGLDDPLPADEMARRLVSLGPRYVLVKGGHGDGDRSEDVLTDGKQVWRLESPRLEGPTHGAGCVLSAALTAWLARGEDVVEAVRRAKSLTWLSIVRRLHLGAGSPIANPSRTLGPDK